jgi:hypothetical protein
MMELPLFDRAESLRHRDVGIEIAVSNAQPRVLEAREIAREVCRAKGEASMDDVVAELIRRGRKSDYLGNAAGGVFRTREFKFVRYTTSARIHAHGNRIGVYRIGGE